MTAETEVAPPALRPVPNEPPEIADDRRSDAPQVTESEQVLLGGLMAYSSRSVRDLRLRTSDFYLLKHAMVFEAIRDLSDAGKPTDPAAVYAALVEHGNAQKVGGTAYLHEMLAVAVIPATFAYHAELIREAAYARNAEAVGVRIQQMARTPGLTAADRAEMAQKLAGELDPEMVAAPSAWLDVLSDTIGEIEDAAANPTGMLGLYTGLPDLDRALRGLRNGMLYVVAGRPGMGKTVVLQGFARANAFKRKLPTALFSLEMNKGELARRMLAADLSIPLAKLETGALDEAQWTRLATALGEEGSPLHVDDTPGQSLAHIRSTARTLKRQGGLSLVLVDYLQLVLTPGRTESREQAVAGLSRGLKLLAKELNVPVVVAAQLNRGSEARTNKRPQLSDLRESGAVEQDADVVILVHRDDYYDRTERVGEADFIIPKNRHGETHTVTVVSQLHYSRFASAELHL